MQYDPQTIDPLVLNELRFDERLLWWGRPDPRRWVKPQSARTYFFLGCIICALAYLFYLCLNNYLFSPNNLLLLLLALLLCFLALLVFVFVALYRLYHKLARDLRHTTYAVTNQRIIVLIVNHRDLAILSHTVEDMGVIQSVETGDGWGDVSYGSPRMLSVGSARTTVIDKLAGIPNVHMIEDLLTRTFKQPQPPVQQVWEYPQF